MYEIYVGSGNGHYDLLYEDTSMAPKLGLIDPVLTLEESKAGNFTTTLPITHPLYSTIQKRITEFRVYRTGALLWKGILLSDDQDFFKQRKLVVEGPLGYLNDTMQNAGEYEIGSGSGQLSLDDCVDLILDTHNAKVDTPHKIYKGDIWVTPNQSVRKLVPNLQPTKMTLTRETSSKQALDSLLSQFGGYFEITYTETHSEPGYSGYPIPELNWKQDFIEIQTIGGVERTVEINDRPYSSQTIIFGQNLMDFTKTVSMNDIATVIVPLGANDEDGNPITIAPVNNNKDYIYVSQAMFDRYGWIERTVKWNDIESETTLLALAKSYATNLQFFEAGQLDIGTLSINITALDMKYLSADADAINLSERVRVYSEYHDTDQYYPCQKMEIHMANPESTIISLGRSVAGNDGSMSTQLSDMDRDLSNQQETEYPDYDSEIADLNNRMNAMEGFAESEWDYDPELTADSYQKGMGDGWLAYKDVYNVIFGLDTKDADNKDRRIAFPGLWICAESKLWSLLVGYYIFDRDISTLQQPTPVVNTSDYRRKIAGHWICGENEIYERGINDKPWWIVGEAIGLNTI